MINITNQSHELDTFIVDFNKSVSLKDKELAKQAIQSLVSVVLKDPVAIDWLVTPANLNELKEMIISTFNVPAKSMQLKNRVPRRHSRAIMLARALRNGIERAP